MGKTAKIKGMFDENGKSVPQAEPGKPVEILGFSEIPPVGAPIVTASIPSEIGVSFTSFTPQLEVSGVEPKLKIIIKADSQGSLEAISSNLPGEVFLILKGVGQITESDVLLAQTSNAEIWGFNVKIPNEVEKLAQTEKVKVQTFKIIYEFLENLEKRILGSGQPQGEEEILGEAEIIAEFAFGGQRVAGSRVLKGRTSKNDNLQLKRGEKIIGEVKALSMKHLKVDINEAKVGEEFGIIFASPIDFKVGDMLISRK